MGNAKSGMEMNLINNNYNQHRNKYQQEVLINEMNFNYLNSILNVILAMVQWFWILHLFRTLRVK